MSDGPMTASKAQVDWLRFEVENVLREFAGEVASGTSSGRLPDVGAYVVKIVGLLEKQEDG